MVCARQASIERAALFLLVLAAFPAYADKGHVTLHYQQIKVDGFESTVGELDIGTVDTQTLYFELTYHLNDRISVHAGIPLVRKRYKGTGPHVPSSIVPPQNDQFIDDGSYHTDWQDFQFSIGYLLSQGPLRVEPFVGYGLPSHDYPHFGHAAVGQNLWRLEIGSRFSYFPGMSDFYFRLDPSYVFVEETLGVSIDHWRLHAEAGYRFHPRMSGRLFVMGKEGKGLDFPDDFPPPRNTPYWFQHDRMVRHNYVNAGLGVDWQASARTQVSVSAMTMVHADQVHIMKYGINLAVSRGF